MRILDLSNAPHCTTGYANQTGLFLPLMQQDGHAMALFAFYGVEGGVLVRDGIPIFPRLLHPYGNDIVRAHYDYHQADCIITLIDPFVLDPDIYSEMYSVMWTPIDCEPVFPETATVGRCSPP